MRLFFITLIAIFFATPVMAEQYIIDVKTTFSTLDEYEECQAVSSTGADCQKSLNVWLENHPDDWGKAARLVRRHQNAYISVPYYAKALEKWQITCAKEDGLASAVISALNLPAEGNEKLIEPARIILFRDCYAAMQASVLKKIGKSNACANLSKEKAISAEQEQFCK